LVFGFEHAFEMFAEMLDAEQLIILGKLFVLLKQSLGGFSGCCVGLQLGDFAFFEVERADDVLLVVGVGCVETVAAERMGAG
jgi:hypothetical protein